MCNIDVKYFPFDQQFCRLVFGSWLFDISALNLSQGPQGVSVKDKSSKVFQENEEWTVESVKMETTKVGRKLLSNNALPWNRMVCLCLTEELNCGLWQRILNFRLAACVHFWTAFSKVQKWPQKCQKMLVLRNHATSSWKCISASKPFCAVGGGVWSPNIFNIAWISDKKRKTNGYLTIIHRRGGKWRWIFILPLQGSVNINRYSPALRWTIILVYTKPANSQR